MTSSPTDAGRSSQALAPHTPLAGYYKDEVEHRAYLQKIFDDTSAFNLEFDPGNPAANKDGYVKMPNVNPLIEMADMREANRSYEANLQAIKQARDMISSTIDLLRSSS